MVNINISKKDCIVSQETTVGKKNGGKMRLGSSEWSMDLSTKIQIFSYR